MKMEKRLILPLVSFFGALYGLYHYLKNVEENSCEMTYMFEYPEYLKVPLSYNTSVKFPRYNLFIYAEGKYVEDLRASRYEGLPVLFIPGNAGSHRQVRSLASVALRMSQSRQTNVHFNFFSIDFNEEISALYGGVLEEQLEFVFESIKHIQSLYSRKKKLILIGHSMGGVIAKAVFSVPHFDPSNIRFILTLASPHLKPVICMDSEIVALYDRIQSAWKFRMKAELRNIPVVSIAGGQRDVLVRSDLTRNRFEHPSPLDVHTLTTSIPGVWLSTDHLAIVWCKQLVLAICRSLFDLVDVQGNEVESVLRFHYVSRSRLNDSRTPSPIHSFPASGQWIEQEEKTWRFSRSKVLSSVYILIPFSQKDRILVIASGLVKGDWLFGCTRFSTGAAKTCAEGEKLSDGAELIPSRKVKSQRRVIHLKKSDLQQKGYVALLIYVAPVNSQVEILSEVYSENERCKHYKLPFLERFMTFAPYRIFTISLVDPVVYYNVSVSRSAGVFQTVEFQLETRLCRAGSVVGQGLVKMANSWNNEVSYYPIRSSVGGVTSIPGIVHSLPPADRKATLHLEFILDPECSVVLSAKFPLHLMAAQFVKFYGTYIAGYSVAFLFVLISDQMNSVGRQGKPSPVYGIFGNVPSFILLVVLPAILYHLVWISGVSFPKPDALDDSYDFWPSLFLRTVLYFMGSGIILCLYASLEMSLCIVTACMLGWKRKNILKTTEVPMERFPKDRLRISKSVVACCSVIAVVCVAISSSLASLMASLYYFVKLCSMHAHCKMEKERRGASRATAAWRFHALLVLLCCVAFLFTVPGLATWLKSVPFSLRLSRDVHVVPCLVTVAVASVLWQMPSPIVHSFQWRVAVLLVRSIALVTTLYGVSSMHRLLYYATLVFSIACVQQTLGYFRLIKAD